MTQYSTEDEKTLRARLQGRKPFDVPEHYFESLPTQIIQKAKARQRRRRGMRWAVAAVMAGCVATAGLALFCRDVQTEKQTELAHTQYIDDALDYSMIDNTEIATYLTEAE